VLLGTRLKLREFGWCVLMIACLVGVVFGAARLVGFNSNLVLFLVLLAVNLLVTLLDIKAGITFFLVLSFLNGFLNRVSYGLSVVNFAFLYAYPQFALFGISVIAFLRHMQHHGGRFRLRLLDKLVLILVGWSLLQALNPNQPIMVGLYGIRFRIVPIFLYFLARVYVTDQQELLRLYRLLLALMLVTAAYGIYQRLAGLPDFEFGWIQAFPAILAQRETTMGGGQGGWYNDGQLRVFSTFSGGNEYNYVMALLSVFFVGFCPLSRGSRWRGWRRVAIALFIFLILLTRERTPVGMFIVGLVIVVLFRIRPSAFRPVALLTMVASLALVALIVQGSRSLVIDAIGGDLAAARLVELSNPFRADTVIWRIERLWIPSMEMIVSNPIGFGLGATRYSRATRTGALLIAPHNTFLEIGLELGVLGLILFTAIVLEASRLALAVKARAEDRSQLYFLPDTILAVFAAAFACGVVSTVLLDVAGLLLWFMLGLIPVCGDLVCRQAQQTRERQVCQGR